MTFLAVHATKGVVSLYAPIYIPSEMSGCPWYQFTGFSRTFYKTGLSSSALCERTLLIFSLQLDFIRETTMYSWIRIKHYRVYFLKESPGNYFMIIYSYFMPRFSLIWNIFTKMPFLMQTFVYRFIHERMLTQIICLVMIE